MSLENPELRRSVGGHLGTPTARVTSETALCGGRCSDWRRRHAGLFSTERIGGFHGFLKSWGYPNNWMEENSDYKWMMTGGPKVDWKPPNRIGQLPTVAALLCISIGSFAKFISVFQAIAIAGSVIHNIRF